MVRSFEPRTFHEGGADVDVEIWRTRRNPAVPPPFPRGPKAAAQTLVAAVTGGSRRLYWTERSRVRRSFFLDEHGRRSVAPTIRLAADDRTL